MLCYISVWYCEIQGEVGQRGQPGEMGYQGDKVRLLSHTQDFKENTDAHALNIMCTELLLPAIYKKIIRDFIPMPISHDFTS